MKRVTSFLSLLVATLFLTGCPTRTRMPAPLKDQLIKNRINKLTTWADDYDNSIAKPDSSSVT